MNKKALAVALASALVVPTAAQAVNVKLSGQVNRAVMFWDDGETSGVSHVDNDNSSSRWRLRGSEKLSNGMEAGVYVEWEYQSNPSNGVTNVPKSIDVGTPRTGTGFSDERWAEVFFSGKWGKVQFGQGAEAVEGAMQRDLSGTGMLNADRQGIGQSLVYRTTGGASSGLNIGNSWTDYDGGRADRVLYSTPVLGPGITLHASHSNRDQVQGAASIRTSFAGGKLDAALGYVAGGARMKADIWGGSASFLFSQGTSITGFYAERDAESGGRDTESWGAKLGHKWGNHAVAVDYSESSHAESNALVAANEDADTETWGVMWMYTIPKPKVELYAEYRNWDLDWDNNSTDDIDIFLVGSRIKF